MTTDRQTNMAWRKDRRAALIAARQQMPDDLRRVHTARIIATLDAQLGDLRGRCVATYWPFRGEPDLRDWMRAVIDAGGTVALPVVVQKAAPLEFRDWHPGCEMERGVWNIPIPSNGPAMIPDIVISPVVGYTPGCYRLGYGGGFYDRTLAALPHKAVVIGIGNSDQATPEFDPLPHDVPMDMIVTEDGVVARR